MAEKSLIGWTNNDWYTKKVKKEVRDSLGADFFGLMGNYPDQAEIFNHTSGFVVNIHWGRGCSHFNKEQYVVGSFYGAALIGILLSGGEKPCHYVGHKSDILIPGCMGTSAYG
jgi:hypothetical protein